MSGARIYENSTGIYEGFLEIERILKEVLREFIPRKGVVRIVRCFPKVGTGLNVFLAELFLEHSGM